MSHNALSDLTLDEIVRTRLGANNPAKSGRNIPLLNVNAKAASATTTSTRQTTTTTKPTTTTTIKPTTRTTTTSTSTTTTKKPTTTTTTTTTTKKPTSTTTTTTTMTTTTTKPASINTTTTVDWRTVPGINLIDRLNAFSRPFSQTRAIFILSLNVCVYLNDPLEPLTLAYDKIKLKIAFYSNEIK